MAWPFHTSWPPAPFHTQFFPLYDPGFSPSIDRSFHIAGYHDCPPAPLCCCQVRSTASLGLIARGPSQLATIQDLPCPDSGPLVFMPQSVELQDSSISTHIELATCRSAFECPTEARATSFEPSMPAPFRSFTTARSDPVHSQGTALSSMYALHSSPS